MNEINKAIIKSLKERIEVSKEEIKTNQDELHYHKAIIDQCEKLIKKMEEIEK